MRPPNTVRRSTDPVQLRDRIIQLRAIAKSVSDRQALDALSAVISDIEKRVSVLEQRLDERSQ